ncbi:hypothetical protein J6590_078249 [Homalodisca vitripennis]|nr:hypothetical protein J6590_078249 [Homalodisca vitripennis]
MKMVGRRIGEGSRVVGSVTGPRVQTQRPRRSCDLDGRILSLLAIGRLKAARLNVMMKRQAHNSAHARPAAPLSESVPNTWLSAHRTAQLPPLFLPILQGCSLLILRLPASL